MRNFSSHAQPLDALIDVNFWSCETIVEDWHQYWRSYFAYEWRYEVVPIFTKVYQDCNLNNTIFETAKAQYTQIRRWAHWAEAIAYVACQWKHNFKKLSFWRMFYELWRLIEWIISWSTLHLILMSWIVLTLVKDFSISSTFSLWTAVSLFTRIAFILLILTVSLQLMFSPWYQLKTKKRKIFEILKFIVVYTWILWPILLIFSWLPALHTQIMLMLNKPMKKFNVTEKIRK